MATATPSMASDCPDQYDFSGSINYYDPDLGAQGRIRTIESNHLNQDVRSLRKGQTTTNASADLRFVINIVPNHPVALELLARMAVRQRTDKFQDAPPYSVECWLHRATVFSTNDAAALLLYGTYLSRRGNSEQAIAALEQANSLRPEDAVIAYNLGLMYFERKDYEKSREFAKKAYAGGFSLPGLKSKLQQAGQWRD